MTIAAALATPNLKARPDALNRIVDRDTELWSNLRQQLNKDYFYRAALIVRNVMYGDWDVETVAFELSLITGGHEGYEKQRAKRELIVKRERQRAKAARKVRHAG